ISSAIAILVSEIREISPLLSNRFTDPRLTPDFSLSLFCEIFLRRRILRIRAAISLSISLGVLDKILKSIIDNILSIVTETDTGTCAAAEAGYRAPASLYLSDNMLLSPSIFQYHVHRMKTLMTAHTMFPLSPAV